MAKVFVTGSVSNVYKSDRGKTYVTIIDMEHGGFVKFSVDGTIGVKEGETVKAELILKGGLDKSGGVYLSYLGGSLKRQTVKMEDAVSPA